MISDANKAVNDLASIVPLLGGSSSRKDYEEARKLVEYLLEHDPDSPLVDMLTARIDAWEDNAVEFEEFNTRIEGHCCKVSDEAAFCLIQRPYISKTLLTRRISPRGSP
ncbi:hypothetical protein [Klebsiella pneumoniae]|uniref:hypothetical protein n=1 Tax=Klebsiella pneumoniae TaxID=573 RepID=UPI001083A44D|nr:hypothetical protein [Klebsiella pneumoniae]VFZ83490.1 putative DNA-binding protein [Klebsiella pneumoniae]